MARPNRAIALVALIATSLYWITTSCSAPPPRARHLLLISVDTLTASRLGCYGGPNRPSPTIDRLAQDGVRFERAYVPRGMTLPSMATYFTSKYPADHGVIDNKHKIPFDEWMLAERLEDSGFKRLAFNASDVLSANRDTAIEQGFAKNAYTTISDDDPQIAKAAASYLRAKFGKNPKREFVWIHLMSPHKPFAPPKSAIDRFDPGYTGEWKTVGLELEPKIEAAYIEQKPPLPDQLKRFLAIYDAEVETADRCIAEILAALDASGVANDTLVVFVADHGEELFLHNLYPYHANSPYRAVTRVPFILRQPGAVPAGRVVEDVVESVDLLPTVLSWLGLEDRIAGDRPENAPRGRDLSPLVTGYGSLEPKYAFGRIDDCADRPSNSGIATLRDPKWSLVVNTDGWLPDFPPKDGVYPIPRVALYDLETNPDEAPELDVASANPEVVARMTAVIEEKVAQLRHREAAFAAFAKDAAEAEAERKKMEELGYLQPGAKPSAASKEPDRQRDPTQRREEHSNK